MGIVLQLVRFLAAVVVVTAFGLPSLASAHEGHAHHEPTTMKVSAPSDSTQLKSTAFAQSAQQVVSLQSFPFHPNAAAVPTNCGSHCCGGAAGMACCGAVLTVEFYADPFVHASEPFLIPHIRPMAGLPPEALRRPPKSFA